jgi:serine/threonine protein kinase/streptogramin lyase
MLPTLPAGFMLGPYKIIQQLGQGGMATVYKAYQASMDRYVALKVLNFQFVNQPEILGRFQHEARLIAKLEHPHILPVYDFGESNGIPYLVMRFLEAGTLKERLSAGPMTLGEIDRIFSQLADALAYAHENGVIHRDIKPSNAMLDKRNQVFLTDFGIAKMMEGSPEFTATGAITGTPSYMSPEQVQGMRLDPRTDIYSLAIMLYEMISGRVPFEAETPMAVIWKQIQEPLPPISKFRQDIHPDIEAVLLKALTKDREERYSNIPAFLEAWKKAYTEATSSQAAALDKATLLSQQSARLEQMPGPTIISSATTPEPKDEAVSKEPIQAATSATPSKTPTPAKTKQNAWERLPKAAKVGIPAIFLCLCVLVSLGVLRNIQKRIQANSPSLTPGQTDVTGSQISGSTQEGQTAEAQMGMSGQANLPAAPAGWRTWTASNTYFTVLASNDLVVAGGYGGLTVWNGDGSESQTLTIRNGLPGETVLSMYLEEEDIFWIGTNEGLARVTNKGTKWERFYEDNGLDSDFVSAITKTDQGVVVGTQYSGIQGGGLNLFDGNRFIPLEMPSVETDVNVPGKLSYNVTRLIYQPGSGLWVGTWHGLGLYHGGQWTVYQDELDENGFVSALYLDHKNILWIAMNEGNVLKFENGVFTKIGNLQEHNVYDPQAIVMDNDGQIWFAGYDGIAIYNLATQVWKEFTTQSNNIPVRSVLSATRNPSGVLYFGTEKEGLLRLLDGKFSTWYLPDRLTYGRVMRIFKSPDNTLWFRQENGPGYEVYDIASQKFLPEPRFDYCCLTAREEDGTGWFIDYDGIRIQHGSEIAYLTQDNGLPSSDTLSLVLVGKKEAWASTRAGLAHILNGEVIETYTPADGLPDGYNPLLFQGNDGSLWVGSNWGLARHNPDGQWVYYLKGDVFSQSMGEIKDIVEDKHRGLVWVAVYGDGLYRFDGSTWQSYTPDQPGVDFSSPYLQALAMLPDDRLAIGFDYGGLVFFQPEKNQWNYYGVEDGLPHTNIMDIFVDTDQSIWLATSGGITQISTSH